MEVAMPMSGSAIDCYEDMFKEITRKLYGEDGLPELSSNERLPMSQDRGLTPIDYDVDAPLLKPDEHITAFGLAALMQNGFPSAGILNTPFQQHKPTTFEDKWVVSDDSLQWTQSKIASYNSAQKLFRCAECDCIGYLPRIAEHWLGTHSNMRVFQCSHCPYESAWARCVRMHLTRQHNVNTEESSDSLLKNNAVLQEITRYLQKLKTKLESGCSKMQHQNGQSVEDFQSTSSTTNNINRNVQQTLPASSDSQGSTANKRYSCTYCPYATDRRDLFTRHENIHREEKPFQCYVCQKQFNRADHVKKHFLRMHREHPYDLNRIRRHPPKNASGMSYYQKYNASGAQTPETSAPTLSNMNSQLSIPSSFNALSRNIVNSRPNGMQEIKPNSVKANSISKSNNKKKGEKRFTCCYCSWSGVDNWCLKRHMNTHLKPFICGLCDYKAARSERLATHVLKVHNKRACGKCTFLADDPNQLTVHQQEHHPLEQRNRMSNMRNPNYTATPSTSFSQSSPSLKQNDLPASSILQHSNRHPQADAKQWKPHAPKQHGAARLFNYMEASDGSEPECDSREDMNRMNLNHRIQSDFPEAGDVGGPLDEEGDETELPLFICQTCGCEFEDDASLETHQYTHCHSTTSPAKSDDNTKENINPQLNYTCQVCHQCFATQTSVILHMTNHSSLTSINSNAGGFYTAKEEIQNKRSRKQSQPKRVVLPFWDSDEIEVLRHLNGKLRKWRRGINFLSVKLFDKYMAQLVTRKGMSCNYCRNSSGLSQYHTRGSLALHHYWRHSRRKRFQCEHCTMMFFHQYQVVLHSSRVHVRKAANDKIPSVPTKEPNLSVPVSEELHNFLATPVPDASVHKLGMSFFDHSFLHTNTTINNHMPIIIPTFPPN